MGYMNAFNARLHVAGNIPKIAGKHMVKTEGEFPYSTKVPYEGWGLENSLF
jgi:hypothetical protein